jgi:hypothetical protein
MASRSAQDHYSDKSEQSQDDRDAADVPLAEATTVATVDDDWLSDLDMTPAIEAESDAEIMAALDDIDPSEFVAASAPAVPVADWLTDVRELARKHGPFSAAQILQMVRELDTPGDEATR